MIVLTALLLLLVVTLAFETGRRRAVTLAVDTPRSLHSRPVYHGAFVALCGGLPALFVLLVWLIAHAAVVEQLVLAQLPEALRGQQPERVALFLAEARGIASGHFENQRAAPELVAAAADFLRFSTFSLRLLPVVVLLVALAGFMASLPRCTPALRAQRRVEKILRALLAACSGVAVLVTIGIVLSLVFEAFQFFLRVPISEFLLGTHWSPQTAIRADQVGSSGAFGAVPVFAGTLLITAIAVLVAAPVGLYSAIYLSEYARARLRAVVKPALEVLAGVPTVVYGFFAALTVGPTLRTLGEQLNLSVASESALAAGLVMGVMIIPFVSSLSDDVIRAVPQSLREGSLGLGATPSETIRRVVLPAALPGIVGALLLAVSRAIGETMIVVMAAGLAANLTANPLEAVTTVTVQIVTLLTGDQEFDSAKTLAAFALGLLLFLVTLLLNVIALSVVRRYREQYD